MLQLDKSRGYAIKMIVNCEGFTEDISLHDEMCDSDSDSCDTAGSD